MTQNFEIENIVKGALADGIGLKLEEVDPNTLRAIELQTNSVLTHLWLKGYVVEKRKGKEQ